MDQNIEIQIFKQEAIRWIDNQIGSFLGDGIKSKFLRPIISEVIDNFKDSQNVDMFLSMFIKDNGFNIDGLLNKYIDVFTEDGGIKFKWGDINEFAGKMLDKEGVINVITANDIKQLKESYLKAVSDQKTIKKL